MGPEYFQLLAIPLNSGHNLVGYRLIYLVGSDGRLESFIVSFCVSRVSLGRLFSISDVALRQSR